MTLLGHFMGDKSWKTKAKRVGFATRSLKVLPGRVGYEALDDVAGFLGYERLIEESEGHAVREGPAEKCVVLAGKNFDVDRDVSAFTGAVAI